jgi:hypothetical protein
VRSQGSPDMMAVWEGKESGSVAGAADDASRN